MGIYAYAHAMNRARSFLSCSLRSSPRFSGVTGDIHPRCCYWRSRSGKAGRVANSPFCRGRAASIDVLCSDKTGTLTRNEVNGHKHSPLPGFDEPHVLGMAALASSVGSEDPVDAAIQLAASKKPPSVCQNSPLLFRSIRLRRPRKQPRRIHRVVQSELSKGAFTGRYHPHGAFSCCLCHCR